MADYIVDLNNPTKYPAAATSLGALLNNVINAVTILAGVLLLLYLVLGGFKYLTAGGDEKAIDAAKRMLTNAVVGLIIVVAAYFIVQVVGKVLGFGDIFKLQFTGP